MILNCSRVLWLQWVPQDVLASPISHGVYSCKSQLVYAAFCDAKIGVFDADSNISCNSQLVYAALVERNSFLFFSFFLRNEMDECCLEEVVRGEYV